MVVRGGTGSSTAITIQPSGGFRQQVTLTTSGVPVGVTVTPAGPVTVSPGGGGIYASSSLTFTATATANPGYNVTVTGMGGGISHVTTLSSRSNGGRPARFRDGSSEGETARGAPSRLS